MNYRHIYMLIVEHAKSEQRLGLRKKGNGEYYEAHHILPRSLFPLWKNKKSNIVLLTAREHFFCHQLLLKIYPCKEMFSAIAIFMQFNNKRNIKFSSKEYELLRKYNGLASSERNKGENNPFYGKKHSKESLKRAGRLIKNRWDSLTEEEKRKINAKKGRLGHTVSEETKEKLRLANLGEKNPMYGQHRKDHPEWKQNGLKGEKHPMYGKHHSEETKKKIGENSRIHNSGAGNPRARKIFCVSNNTLYNTVKEFAQKNDINEQKVRDKLCKKTKNDIVSIDNIFFRYFE